MKRTTLLLLICFLFACASSLYAGERAPLGKGNIALKIDYIKFTDDDLDDADVDEGLYLALEGYGEIISNVYVGAEVGYANPDGSVDVFGVDTDTEVTFVPIEANLKYVFEVVRNFSVDLGAGGAYIYVEKDLDGPGISDSDNDWLLGWQVFADLNYVILNIDGGSFFFGANVKYQVTEDFEDEHADFYNWRFGGQIGYLF